MDHMVALAITRFYLDYLGKDLVAIATPDAADLPWSEVSAQTRVFVVGFSPRPDPFARLLDEAGDVVWIDNGVDGVRSLESASTTNHDFRKIKGRRSGDLSLSELTWDSYFAWMRSRPEVVDLVGRYTMGDDRQEGWASRILPFSKGLSAQGTDPFDAHVFEVFWKEMLCLRRDPDEERRTIDELIERGRAL
jgi:hypothetical protein